MHLRGRTMSRIVSRPRGEDGMAMVLTIGLMMLTAIIAATLLTTTVFSTSNTSATRVDVESIAAAEAGIEATMVSLQAGTITCDASLTSLASPNPALDYQVTVTHKPAGSAVWLPGCAVDADAIRLVSVASAQSVATGGNQRGNEATAELLMERPNPQPFFTQAIFGDVQTTINTALTLTPTDPGQDANIFTNGDYICSSNSVIDGSVYARGNGTFSSAPCTVDGDVYIGGNFTCGGGLTIGGDLYVQGSITLSSGSCKINGNVWSGGGTSIPNGGTPIGGNLYVRGNYSTSGLASIGGAIRVRGSFTGGAYWLSQYQAAYPTMVLGDAGLGFPPAIPTGPDYVFPRLSQTQPATEHPFEGFAVGNWQSVRLASLTSPWDTNACSPWSSSLTEPITITADTVFDTTSLCSTLEFRDIKFVLQADAAIYVRDFKKIGAFEAVSGDGEEHSLYIVQPWPTSMTQCGVGAPSQSIRVESGTWTQDNRTRILLYSPNFIEFKGDAPHLRGQLYGCTVKLPVIGTQITYAPAGAQDVDMTLTGLDLQYIRDVTN